MHRHIAEGEKRHSERAAADADPARQKAEQPARAKQAAASRKPARRHGLDALLEEVPQATEIVIMMQKEVAKRFAAKQGSRDSSAVTLAVQYYSEIEELFDVSKHCFYPAPKEIGRAHV